MPILKRLSQVLLVPTQSEFAPKESGGVNSAPSTVHKKLVSTIHIQTVESRVRKPAQNISAGEPQVNNTDHTPAVKHQANNADHISSGEKQANNIDHAFNSTPDLIQQSLMPDDHSHSSNDGHNQAKKKNLVGTIIELNSQTLHTIQQFSKKFPAFTESALRNLINRAKQRHSSMGAIPGNGLDQAIVRVGRKVLINEIKFFEWVNRLNNGGHQ